MLELSTIINNPKKNKIFFAALGSLITATAMKITELLCGDTNKEQEKNDIPIEGSETESSATNIAKPANQESENNHLLKLIKHSGKQKNNEKALEMEINNVIQELNPDINHKNALVSLYNKFCGLNNRGTSFDNENNEVSNVAVSELILTDIKGCSSLEELDAIFARYESYTSEKKDLLNPLINEEIVIPKCIANKDNIKNAYKNLDKNNRIQVDEFFTSLCTEDVILKKTAFQKINKIYSDSLTNIATIYKLLSENSPEEKRTFLINLSNGLITSEALSNYITNNETLKIFDFLDYNSFIYGKLPENSINELTLLKNKGELHRIRLNFSDDSYEIELHNTFLGKSFRTILDTFKIINNDSSKGLNAPQKEYTINDIDTEIKSNSSTYPLLMRYLTIKDKNYLNQGKEEKLLDIYNGAKLNKDLFTVHSYLRFLERYVMPELNSCSENKIYASQIKTIYLKKITTLKNAINTAMQKPINVFVYSIDDADIKAPKIKIPYKNGTSFFEITLNDQAKIHTIF